MDTIGTVNFEDLFDFSPEPLDSNSNQGSSVVNNNDGIVVAEEAILAQQAAGGEKRTGNQVDSKNFNNQGTNCNFIEKVTDTSSLKLSQSAPTNWGSHFPDQSRNSFVNTSTDQSDASFNTSVNTLLEELPEQIPVTAQKGKRGRKPGQRNLKTDMKSKLERSRQSARECRARKKLRYQYLDDLILEREKANFLLRDELNQYLKWCQEMDANPGVIPEGLQQLLQQIENEKRGL